MKKLKQNFLLKFTQVNFDILSKYISKGDTVVDATVGNGYDTLNLVKLVSNTGKVYGFDIQKEAIENTEKLLTQQGMLHENIQLINNSHSMIDKYIHESVQAIVFNLGYLPKGNHNITTNAETTILAIKQGLELLKVNGIIALLIYSGHKQGKIEKEHIIKYGQSLDSKKYHVMMMNLLNHNNDPPCLMFITKKNN